MIREPLHQEVDLRGYWQGFLGSSEQPSKAMPLASQAVPLGGMHSVGKQEPVQLF